MVVLSEDNELKNNKDGSKKPAHQANQHKWIEQWTREDSVDVSNFIHNDGETMTHKASFEPNCSDNSNHLALADRGANDTAAGEDCVCSLVNAAWAGRSMSQALMITKQRHLDWNNWFTCWKQWR